MALYKTITLGLIQHQKELHQQLCQSHRLLAMVNQLAMDMKELHEHWIKLLTKTDPSRSETTTRAEALEMAIDQIKEVLRIELLPPDSELLSIAEMTKYETPSPPA